MGVTTLPTCPHCGSDDVVFVKDVWVCITCGKDFNLNEPIKPDEPDQTNKPPSPTPFKPTSTLADKEQPKLVGFPQNHTNTVQSTPPTLTIPQQPTETSDFCGNFADGDAWLLDDWFRKPQEPPKTHKLNGKGDENHNPNPLSDNRPHCSRFTQRKPDGTILLSHEGKTETVSPTDLNGWKDWDEIQDVSLPKNHQPIPPIVVLDIECEGVERNENGDLNLNTGNLIAVGLLFADGNETQTKILRVDECGGERELLETTFGELKRFAKLNPNSILTGYNILGFDLPFIINRCFSLGIHSPFWFETNKEGERITLRVAATERTFKGEPIKFQPIRNELGMRIVDTLHLVCRWDYVAKELKHHDLKSVAEHFGIRHQNRIILSPEEISKTFKTNPDDFNFYLSGDLVECYEVFKRLFPPYWFIAQLTNLPVNEVCVRSKAWV